MLRIRLTSRSQFFVWLLMIGLIANSQQVSAQRREPTKAPANHALLSNTVNGWYFVPMEFKQQYDATLARLETLQGDVESGRLTAKKAQTELQELKQRLEMLRKEIDAKRVVVTGASIQTQTETLEFPLGAEKRLAITTNHVHLIGWDGPNVKVELKKIVLAPDETSVTGQLKAIKIVHEHGRAKFAGRTPAEIEKEENDYFARQGDKVSEAQKIGIRLADAQIQESMAIHRDFLGKEVDQITVRGLEYDQNQCIEMSVMSPGGTGQFGTVRQRYAELTVYVPQCVSVCVRGARRGLLVEKLNAALTVVDEDSTDSNASSKFEVHGVAGNLTSVNFPLQVITDIKGHAQITATPEFGLGGLGHFNELRDLRPAQPMPVQVHNVGNGVDLKFGHVRLDLREIQGQISVSNEFGDTHLVATQPFSQTAHRILTQSGRIEVELSPAAWASLPILAFTNYGGIRTNVEREEFEDFNLGGVDKQDGLRRSWPGFRTVVKNEERFAFHIVMERFQQIIGGTERSAGLDLFSRSGSIVILRK